MILSWKPRRYVFLLAICPPRTQSGKLENSIGLYPFGDRKRRKGVTGCRICVKILRWEIETQSVQALWQARSYLFTSRAQGISNLFSYIFFSFSCPLWISTRWSGKRLNLFSGALPGRRTKESIGDESVEKRLRYLRNVTAYSSYCNPPDPSSFILYSLWLNFSARWKKRLLNGKFLH